MIDQQGQLVRIRYWSQETIESGRWMLSGLVSKATAERILKTYERAEIVPDSEGK